MVMTATAITAMQRNIAGTNGSVGTGTIIGTIMIETMIGTTTGIEASRFSLRSQPSLP